MDRSADRSDGTIGRPFRWNDRQTNPMDRSADRSRWTDRQTDPMNRSADRSDIPIRRTATDIQLWYIPGIFVFSLFCPFHLFIILVYIRQPFSWRSLFYCAVLCTIFVVVAVVLVVVVVVLAAAVRAFRTIHEKYSERVLTYLLQALS